MGLKSILQSLGLLRSSLLSHVRQLQHHLNTELGPRMDHHNFFGIVRQDPDPRLRMDRHLHKQECMQLCRQLILMLLRRRLSNMKEFLTHLLLEQFSSLTLKPFEQHLDQSHR